MTIPSTTGGERLVTGMWMGFLQAPLEDMRRFTRPAEFDLRQAKALPQWMSFMERDETLPIDLDNPLSVDAFLHVLKRTGEGVLQEMYPSPAELCVTGSEGRFQHEILIHFSRQKREAATKPLTAPPELCKPDTCARKLPPGSDWVFFKIYAGPATLDEMLKTTVPPLVRSAFAEGLASRWFFIRYADPDLHLRLRFQIRIFDRRMSCCVCLKTLLALY